MTTIQFLDAGQAAERGVEVPDVYYCPAYGRTAELVDGGVWECAVDGATGIAYPYLRRPLPGSDAGGYDTVSPYGYAGACGKSRDVRALGEFRRRFLAVSRERGLVAEFIRCNPYDADEATVRALLVDGAHAHPTYGIEVGEDPAAYWDVVTTRHRTTVRKAQRLGVEVAQAPVSVTRDARSGFRRIYDETMQRLGAAERLRLDDAYFDRLAGGLAEHAVVLEANLDGQACAAALFLRWGSRLHYHLSGATAAGRAAGATSLLIDAAVRTLLPPGGRLHLGGGLVAGDGLAQFKRSVATAQYEVFLCRNIVDPVRYGELTRRAGRAVGSDYFPAYRAPASEVA